jgi:large subunit ribosomal protein L15
MKLNEIRPAKGHASPSWRRGRGPGTGNGKTAGRGSKGQRSRSGHSARAGFEGGQMPLFRRVPKRGFNNPFRVEYAVVNTGRLDKLFEPGTRVTVEELAQRGLVRKNAKLVKVLGNGELTKSLTLVVHKVSEAARKKIEANGGSIELVKG